MTELSEIIEKIAILRRELSFDAEDRKSADAKWQQVANNLPYYPVDYSPAMIDYQAVYWSGNGFPTIDISLVLLHDRRPCGIWPLSLTAQSNGLWTIGSNGTAILPPLFISGLSRKSIKSRVSECLVFLDRICNGLSQRSFLASDTFTNRRGLSEWHNQLMYSGATATLYHDIFLDLSLSLTEIKSNFRKSYRALVTSGSKLWKTEIVTTGDLQQWNEFRQLHCAVAGRVTRSDESWQLQHQAIIAGNAFFVCLRDHVERMVGGGLFYVTGDEGVYAVGAYDRSLFDKPLGHVVQFHAIEEMTRRRLSWYKLGARVYPGDNPMPTPKEIAISEFKQGFSSDLFPRYSIRRELKYE